MNLSDFLYTCVFQTIFVEPLFLNAYWHRHFIYLFQDKVNDALDDLNFINKYNKNHAGGLQMETVTLPVSLSQLSSLLLHRNKLIGTSSEIGCDCLGFVAHVTYAVFK